jgi:hypothetical protein
VVDLSGVEDAGGLLVAEKQVREQAFGKAGDTQSLGETLAGERSLGAGLQDHGIAGEQRRDDGVGGGEEGVVPGGKHQDEADRHPRHVTAARGNVRSERRLGEVGQGANALGQGAKLAGVADRPPHLPRELGDDLGVELLHRVEEATNDGAAVGERGPGPLALRRPPLVQGSLDLGAACQRPPRIFATVDRRDADQLGHATAQFPGEGRGPVSAVGLGPGLRRGAS